MVEISYDVSTFFNVPVDNLVFHIHIHVIKTEKFSISHAFLVY